MEYAGMDRLCNMPPSTQKNTINKHKVKENTTHK